MSESVRQLHAKRLQELADRERNSHRPAQPKSRAEVRAAYDQRLNPAPVPPPNPEEESQEEESS